MAAVLQHQQPGTVSRQAAEIQRLQRDNRQLTTQVAQEIEDRQINAVVYGGMERANNMLHERSEAIEGSNTDLHQERDAFLLKLRVSVGQAMLDVQKPYRKRIRTKTSQTKLDADFREERLRSVYQRLANIHGDVVEADWRRSMSDEDDEDTEDTEDDEDDEDDEVVAEAGEAQ